MSQVSVKIETIGTKNIYWCNAIMRVQDMNVNIKIIKTISQPKFDI